VEGLHGHFSDLHGVDSWQALQLAHQIIAHMLVHFVKDGGQLFDPETRQPVTPEQLFTKLSRVAKLVTPIGKNANPAHRPTEKSSR
jgi:hypothetical protein